MTSVLYAHGFQFTESVHLVVVVIVVVVVVVLVIIPWNRVLSVKLRSTQLARNSLRFMETYGSFSYSQSPVM